MGDNHEVPWWKNAVIYQIYPRSFCDSNGDGIGDIPGILGKLDYLQRLGVDAVWLSPVYRSPQDDNGYDISDYRAIDPIFGTMEDMERLLADTKARGMRVIMDLVLNHSSDEHFWFREAKKSRDNPYHDYYIWRDAPPNDLPAAFGGSAWEWVPEVGQYYFHQFSPKQPDLNWDNPALRRELYDMIRWWADKGVGGFRLDVVDHLGKEPDNGILVNGPHLHERLRELRREAFGKEELVTVGEAWSVTTDTAKRYSAPDGSELSMMFPFEPFKLDQREGGEKWDLAPLELCRLKEVIARWQTELHGRGWCGLFWENHDLPRIVSRWGDDVVYRAASARMFAVLLFGLEGTPFVYQGQELGMTNAAYPIEDYRDIEAVNVYRTRLAAGMPEEDVLRSIYAKCRDNARTPMPWSAAENAGFTDGTPWLRVNPNYRTINVESQLADEHSVLACYRALIALRKAHAVFRDGEFALLLPEDEAIFAYTRTSGREQLTVVCNFTGGEVPCPLAPEGRLVYHSGAEKPRPGTLRPYEAYMVLRAPE